jgi:hypothetical protein
MNGPLAVLETIDWSGVTDCYGPVDELPTLLRATLSADEDERCEAFMGARNQVNHQGDVCEASVHIVPFLAQAALSATNDRDGFVDWLAWSCGRTEAAWEDRTGLVDRVRAAALVALPDLAMLIADPDPAVRRASVVLIAAFPHEVTAPLVEPDPLVRADLLTVIAYLRPRWAGLPGFLATALSDEDHRVRYQAARVLMRISGTPYPSHLVEALADVIADLGRPDGELDAIEQFCGVEGHFWPISQATGVVRVRTADPLVQDPTAATHAARRILRPASAHPGYTLTLARQIDREWRGRENDTAPLALEALPAITQPKKQYETVRWIARQLAELRAPGGGLLALLEPWSAHPDPVLAAAAWAAAAHLDQRYAMDRIRRITGLSQMPLEVLCELCTIYGSEADVLIPELQRRIQALPRVEAPRDATALLGAVQALSSRAVEFLPQLHAMLARGQGLYALVETLGALGDEADETADLVAAVARNHERQQFRLRAALAHRTITGEHTLARQVADQIAKSGSLDHSSAKPLGLLGPDAQACTVLLEEQLAQHSGLPSEIQLALWRITRNRDQCQPLLARSAKSPSSAIPALQGLLEIGECPDDCHDAIAQYASSQQRILHNTRLRPPRHDDYLLQELAFELLAAALTPRK